MNLTRLHRSFLTLSLGEALARLVGFGATVYVARSLGAGAYGVVGVAAAVRLYLVCLVEAGVDSVGMRQVAAAPASAGSLAGSLLLARLGIAAGLALLLAVLAPVVLPGPDGAILALYGLSLLPVALNTRWLHLGLGHSRAVAVARLAGEAAAAAVVLLGVRSADDLVLVPVAQFAGDAVAALLLAGQARRVQLTVEMRFRALTAALLVQAWPLAAHALLGLVIFNADLLLLRLLWQPETAGYYAGAYALIGFLLNLGLMHYQSLLPALAAAPGPLRGELYRSGLRQALAAGLPVALAAGLLAGPMLRLAFGPGFAPAVAPLQLLLLSVPLGLLRQVGQAALVAGGLSGPVLRSTVWSVLLALGLDLALIPVLGMRGAALATVGTELFRSLVVLGWATRAGYPPPWQARLARPLVGALVMGASLWWLGPGRPVLGLGLGAAMYLAVLAIGAGKGARHSPPEPGLRTEPGGGGS